MTICPLVSCFSLETSVTMSHLRTVVLVHSGSLSVADTTYLGMLLSMSASSPLPNGHRAAKSS